MFKRKSELYNYIQKYKEYDSDFWSSGHGNVEILSMLLKFTDNSWELLKNEIAEWNSNEIEILADALCDDESWYYRESIEINLNQRSYLFAYIFATIETNVAFDLLDDFEFIFKGKPKEKKLLEFIKIQIENIKVHPSIHLFYPKDRISKIENEIIERIKASS
jgi:DNA-binding ferritin-like protein (Dps family)